jgi:glycosyltransferase involved in cell wall biosynthesis
LPDIAYGTQCFFIRSQIIRLSFKGAKAVTAGSAYQLNLAQQQGLDMSKAYPVPLGVDVNQFQPAKTPALDQPTIVQAASLTPVKNQALLLETVALIKKELPNIQLLLAGDGPLRPQLTALAQSLHIQNAITWAGAVPFETMPQFFQQGHLYLQTSRHESQGMAVLEAMACGLPVLGTPVGVTAELAHLPPTNNAIELAAQTIKTLSETANYGRLRQQARQQVLDHYSLEKTTQRFLTIYQDLSNQS